MATQEKGAGSGANAGASGVNWNNPINIIANDGIKATVVCPYTSSKELHAEDFDFSIPAGATIDGIKVWYDEFASSTPFNVQLLKAGSTTGTGKTLLGEVNGTYRTWGGSTDKWGTTWTPAEVNASGFGVSFQVLGTGLGNNGSIDYAKITVYYTEAAGGRAKQVMMISS